MIKVNFSGDKRPAPLFLQYEGQFEPQQAYIEIDPESRTVCAGCAGDSTVPMEVNKDLLLRLDISPKARGPAIESFLLDANIQKLMSQICDGYDCYFNGRNLVGRYTDYADEAYNALQAAIYTEFQDDSDSCWESCGYAGDWVWQLELKENWREGQTLSEAVEECRSGIEENRRYIDGDHSDFREAILMQVDSDIGILYPEYGDRLPEYMWADLLAEDKDKYGAFCCPVPKEGCRE
jgi:hypothetical protein